MPMFRVGVMLRLRGSGYTTGMQAAAAQTTRFGGVLDRTAGRATTGLRRVASAAGGVRSALQRTAGATRTVGAAARRMADTMGAAVRRVRGRVNSLITRMGVLGTASRTAGGGLGGGLGRLAGAAGGGYLVMQAVRGEAAIEQRYTNLAVSADLDKGGEADMRRRIEAAALASGVSASKLLAASQAEYTLTGEIAPILEDLEVTGKFIRTAGPDVQAADVGKMRAAFVSFEEWGDAEGRQRFLNQTIASGWSGSIEAADLARSATEAIAAQTEVFGNRSGADFLIAAQRAQKGYGKADPTMTALATFARVATIKRQDIEQLIGSTEGLGLHEVAEKLVAATGSIEALSQTKLFEQENIAAIAGITGQAGTAVGRAVEDTIRQPDAELTQTVDAAWRRQAETTAALLEVAKERAQQEAAGWIGAPMRFAVQQVTAHQSKLMSAGVLAAAGYGTYRLARGARSLFGRVRGGGAGGGLAGAGLSTVATMRVGTLIVSSMPGAGGRPGAARRAARGAAATGAATTGAAATGAAATGAAATGAAATGMFRRAGGMFRRQGALLRAVAGKTKGVVRGAAPIALTLGGIEVASSLAAGDREGAVESAAGTGGALAGTAAGAAAGAAIGSVVPIVGTAIGGLIGGLAGGGLGYWGGSSAADWAMGDDDEGAAGQATAAGQAPDAGDLTPFHIAHYFGRGAGQDPATVTIDDSVHVTIQPRTDGSDPAGLAREVADEVERRQVRTRQARHQRLRASVVDDTAVDPAF